MGRCYRIAIINAFAWGVGSVNLPSPLNESDRIIDSMGKSFSVYLEFYLDNDYFPGTSSLAYSFVGGTNFLAALWVAPFVNILARHAGTKACM